MAETHKAVRRSSKELIPPLLIGTFLALIVLGLYFFGPKLRPIDAFVLLVGVVFVALGFRQRILRGIATIIILYFATGVAATFYRVTAPYVGAPLGGVSTPDTRALAFFVLTVVIWILLEGLSHVMFKDVSMPQLGVLDNIGGVLVHLVVGFMVAMLLFNTLGYTEFADWPHDNAKLRPLFREAMNVYYSTQSFWFSKDNPPYIYTYDLGPSSEQP